MQTFLEQIPAAAQVEAFLAKSSGENADPLDTFVAVSDVIGQAARQWEEDKKDPDLGFLDPIIQGSDTGLF